MHLWTVFWFSEYIFSHSTLKEGWDNPNVFQICTLLKPKTEFTRRQKIGRGLRLCVNQNGERIEDKNINQLYVISDENFAEFAKGLQKNYEDDFGMTFDGITIQFLSEITSKKEVVQLRLDDEQIAETIELNKKTGAIDENGVVIAPENIAIPIGITSNREQITEAIKTSDKIDKTVLQTVPVEIKKIVEEELSKEIIQETIDEFAKIGYFEHGNRPSQPMKEALKQGAQALQLPERAEYARQEIFNFLNNQYSTPDISNVDNTDTARAKREVIFSTPFKRLWDKIKTKTRYKIELTDNMLKANVLLEIASNRWSYVSKVKIVYADAEIDIKASGVYAESSTESGLQTVDAQHRLPDVLRNIGEQCNISKKLAYKIFEGCGKVEEFLNNPQIFMEQLVEVINKVKRRMKVVNIVYIPTGSSWDYAQVFDNFQVNTKTNAVLVENSLCFNTNRQC